MITYTIKNIKINIEKKKVKNINIKVHSDMQVYVSCPKRANIEYVKQIILSKLNWLENQIQKLKEREQQENKKYVSEEEHYFNGKKYILKINPVEKAKLSYIKIEDQRYINMYIPENTTIENKEKLMNNFYKENLIPKINEYMEKWSLTLNIRPKGYKLRKMKTLWGSCNITKQTILFNTELAKKRDQAIEYVVVHELMHLIEKYHNKRFYSLLDYYYPNWKTSYQMLK